MSGASKKRAAESDQEPARKKAKSTTAFTPTQRIVEVILEVDQQSITYNIHEDLLRQHSAYLNEKLEDTAERKPLIINDVDKDTLDTFSLWLYSKKLTVNELEHP